MRNLNTPTLEHLASFTGVDGKRWFAMTYYPNGKKDRRYWWIDLSFVGARDSESIKCASVEAYAKERMRLTQWQLI